jgi:hypothetical protein
MFKMTLAEAYILCYQLLRIFPLENDELESPMQAK